MRIRCTLILLLAVSGIFAQDLRLPSTPAFSILGHEPSAVMRPTSTKKLSSDILGAFDEQGKLLMDLGLEVTPYWLQNRPNLTREQYLNPSVGQAILQSFTVSAATVKDSITNNNNLGVGFRFEIVRAGMSPSHVATEAEMKELETFMAQIIAVDGAVPATDIDAAIKALEANLPKSAKPDSPTAKKRIDDILAGAKRLKPAHKNVREFTQALHQTLEEESKKLAQSIIEKENKRIGFSLETASAFKFITTTGNQAFQKAGFWVNANYYASEKNGWTVTARLMTNTADTLTVNTDVGAAYIRQEKDFNISLESMFRWYRSEVPDVNGAGEAITRLEKDFTYRIAAQASYTITSDVSVNLSIGKDFDDPVLGATGIFSILGINYSLFNKEAFN